MSFDLFRTIEDNSAVLIDGICRIGLGCSSANHKLILGLVAIFCITLCSTLSHWSVIPGCRPTCSSPKTWPQIKKVVLRNTSEPELQVQIFIFSRISSSPTIDCATDTVVNVDQTTNPAVCLTYFYIQINIHELPHIISGIE